MAEAFAFCDEHGVIGIAGKMPRGEIRIGSGPSARVREIIEVIARHGYDGETVLVPGLPEAEHLKDALNALVEFRRQFDRRLAQ